MVNFMKYNRTKIVIQIMLVTIISTLTIFMCITRKNVTVVVDGKPLKLVTYQKTFDSALKKADISIDVKDTIDKALSSKIVNNDVITINRAVNLRVFVDNKELNIKSSEKDIALMLSKEKISVSPNDKISPPTVTKLSKGLDVIITRVKTETIHQTKPVDFKTVIKKDSDTLKSQSKVSQKGVKGEKSITLNVTYENGTEVTRKVIKETLVKAPKNKIIVQGTMKAVTYSRGDTSSVSENIVNLKASPASSGKSFTVKATAYSPVNGSNSAYTASGRKAVRNPNGISTIAVDPRVIPLGTKLYVEGYGNAVAADTGSAIQGKFIDLYFNTNKEASNFGVKYVKVQILD